MNSVVADTHAVVWYLLHSKRLSRKAYSVLDGAASSGSHIYVASISIVEVCYLVEAGKLPSVAMDRLNTELDRPDPSLIVVPLDLAIARSLTEVPRNMVREMPDRIIAATALYLGLSLVTRDHGLLASDVETIW